MTDLNLMKKLNLAKDVVLDLTKGTSLFNKHAAVILCMDISISMRGLYEDGTVQAVLERIVPIAMAFDNDKAVEVYVFEDGVHKVSVNCTMDNLSGFVQREILSRYRYGGTNYAPAINEITSDFIGDPRNVTKVVETETKQSGGFLGLFTKSETTTVIKGTQAKQPGYVLFITDGENFDRGPAERAIDAAAEHAIHWVMVGLQTGNCQFTFLDYINNKKGRARDNVTHFVMSKADLVDSSNSRLYNALLEEFPQWYTDAVKDGILLDQ